MFWQVLWRQTTQFENITGFISLLLYVLTLAPSIFRIISKDIFKTKFIRHLLKRRRDYGIGAWIFAMMHGIYIVWQRNLNLLEPETAAKFFQGITLITIFTLLAITSNDYSVRKLKKNWKRLHRLTYLALIFLPWHILDKMQNRFSFWSYLGITLLSIATVFFVIRWFKVFTQK
jgi:sulfoxide reductase heme-binding subunit YedZ